MEKKIKGREWTRNGKDKGSERQRGTGVTKRATISGGTKGEEAGSRTLRSAETSGRRVQADATSKRTSKKNECCTQYSDVDPPRREN